MQWDGGRSGVQVWICYYSSWWKCQVGTWTSEAEKGKVWAEEVHLEIIGIWVEFKDMSLDDMMRISVHGEKKDLSNYRGCAASEVYEYIRIS